MKKSFLPLAFSLVIAGCQFQQPGYLQMVSADELHDTMQKQNILLIDVHTPEQRHIKGTDLYIPYNQVEQYQEKLPADKNAPIYLYCEGGPMGNAAARALHNLGYNNLYNLNGGSHAWQQAGYAFE